MVSSRPTLIYLPGLDGSGKLFHHQEPRLAPYCTTRALSLPTHRKEDWQSLAEQVYTLVPKHRPALLCGESFGGCLALWCALKRPELFSHLILVNPASSWRRQKWLVQGAHSLEVVPEEILKATSILFLPFLCSIPRITAQDWSMLQNVVSHVPKKTILQRLRLLEQFNLDGQLEQIKLPTLLLGSQADRLLPSYREINYLAQRLPNTYLEALPESGHAALIESGVDLASHLLKCSFLDKDLAHK